MTSTQNISARERNVSRHAAADSAAGFTPPGMLRHTQIALARLRMPIRPNAVRQPQIPPTSAPSGKPMTDASDQPRNTTVMARPRCSAGTSKPMHAAACGVKIAGAIMVITRTGSNALKLGAAIEAMCSSPYHTIESVSRRRRSHPATTAASDGAPRHISKAAAEISCPAVATDICSEVLISFSVPGTTITPVPITKLPNSSGHRTAGSAAGVLAAPEVVFTDDK